MPMLHDRSFQDSVAQRLKRLRPDAERQWGKMTADQMLWHLNSGLESALGRLKVTPVNVPLPKFMLKFLVITVPWRKGKTPTRPEFEAKDRYDFEDERARTLRLVDEFCSKPVDGAWHDNAFLGPLSGAEWSRLQGKHVDYHLRQFGA